MKILIFIIALSSTFTSFSQSYNKENSTIKRIRNLYLKGELDTIEIKIISTQNSMLKKDTTKELLCFKDTVLFSDGSYNTGIRTLDCFEEYNFLKVGIWEHYDPKKKLLAIGSYQVFAKTHCSAGGPSTRTYALKAGFWKYFYSNENLMLAGEYLNYKVNSFSNCGKGEVYESKLSALCKMYDKNGQVISSTTKAAKMIINKLEKKT